MIIISENRKNRCIMEFLKKKKLLAKIVSYLLYIFRKSSIRLLGFYRDSLLDNLRRYMRMCLLRYWYHLEEVVLNQIYHQEYQQIHLNLI